MMIRFWATFLSTIVAAAAQYGANYTNSSMAFSFKEIPTTPTLDWTPCFGNFTCMNLQVPLDYSNLTAGTTHIAFMKLAATTQPAKGDILVNAGGPGNSAANALFITSLLPILGTSYNIVGMDPRGVNNSGPSVECFKDTYDREYALNTALAANLDTKDEGSRRDFWLMVGGLSDWCSKARSNAVRYINTPAIAHDMLYYSELLAETQSKVPSESLVNFYGVSYGTVLGATFAKLFPHRLGRFILDGVADIEDYYSGEWTTGILQADEAMEAFFKRCYEAGPKCRFYTNSTSIDEMRDRFDAILADVEQNPLVITDPELVQYPTVMKATDIRSILYTQLYEFIKGFPVIAGILSGLEQDRNATALTTVWAVSGGTKGKIPSELTHVDDHSPVLSRMAITCNDMNKRYNISSPEMFSEYIEKQIGVSRYFGETWATLMTVRCWNWQITPPESQLFPAEFGRTPTNSPILLTGNKIDPFTSSPFKMAPLFPGSHFMLQDGVGHGVPGIPSSCTSAHILNFVETGELPPNNTICQVDVHPFQSPLT